MPIVERDPWRYQFFEAVPCPDHVMIPTDDPDCWTWYPKHRWIYDKLKIAESQGLTCGPHGVSPPAFPVFSKPMTNLKGMGIDVVAEASDGRQAVELTRQLKPSLVTMDLDMPVMNGLGALRFILAARPKTKAVMITGRSDREAIVQAVQAGAKGYIVKPFHPDKVMSVIGKLLT